MIEIRNLKKKFGKAVVLKDVNFAIGSGKVTAVIGPNGSGKTTIIKTILGLVKPSEGSIEVNGSNIDGDYLYRNRIGYMPQIARYPENLTANELISLVKDLRRPESSLESEILSSFRLTKEMEKPFKSLSGGTKQKVSAFIAFAFDPEILILDEPTAGLDPISSSYFKDLVLKEKEKGKTIILTSHIMSELQELADEIIFLLEGEVKFKGTVTELMENKSEATLERAIAGLMNR